MKNIYHKISLWASYHQWMPGLVCFIVLLAMVKKPLKAQNDLASIPDSLHLTQSVDSSAFFTANAVITANNRLLGAGSRIIYQANGRVRLEAGFGTELGTRFSATTYVMGIVASDNASDAYVQLNWVVNPLFFEPYKGQSIHLELVDITHNTIVYEEIIEQFPSPEDNVLIAGAYRHYAGPDQQATYQMNLREVGSGDLIHDYLIQDAGSTLPFQPFSVTATTSHADRIEVSWQGEQTDLDSYYRVYRNDSLVATLDSLQHQYTDRFLFSDPENFVNGTAYTYKVEAYSQPVSQTYIDIDSMTATGSTYALQATATDTAYPDQVVITWNDVASFADAIKIKRDGEEIIELASDVTTYTDPAPVFGKTHEYTVVLVKDGQEIVASYDVGHVQAQGMLAGRVTTLEGDYAVRDVQIIAEAVIAGDTVRLNTVTDHAGYYHFSEVYYGISATYTLLAIADGHTFQQNQQSQLLNNQQFTAGKIEFKDLAIYDTTGTADLTFTNLSLQPQPDQDRVQLSWDYTVDTGDTVYFKIYRDGERIAFLHDAADSITSYLDMEGTPGSTHAYQVAAYVHKNGQVTEQIQQGTLGFPVVAPITDANLTVSADTLEGKVDFNWTHTSDNLTGFYLYRDGQLVADLPKTAVSYTDLDGVSGVSHTYAIEAYVVKSGQTFQSQQTTRTVIYPILPEVLNTQAVAVADNIQLTWELPVAIHEVEYNLDGYYIFRQQTGNSTTLDTLGSLLKGFTKTFTDNTGLPGQSYDYFVHAVKVGKDTTVISANTGALNILFPEVTAPQSLVASDGTYEGHVIMTWTHSLDDHTGFVIERNGTEIARTPVGTRNYTDVFDGNLAATDVFTYTVKAYLEREGNTYYSTAISDQGSIGALTGTDYPNVPVAFTASKDYPNHVLLQWDYVDYILPKFRVYRDGVLIDSVDADQRVYYDGQATSGAEHLYQLDAHIDTLGTGTQYFTSKRVSATGGLHSIDRLEGVVTAQSGGFGIAGVPITASVTLGNGDEYIATTTTDAAGYYRVEGIPRETGLVLQVQAGQEFIADPLKTVTLQANQGTYIVDFTDNFDYPVPEPEGVTLPIVAAQADPLNHAVTIRWHVLSSNYSGFEVYRGLTQLAHVQTGQPMVIIDSTGTPGQEYEYRVKAYWETNETRDESPLMASLATFPVVVPVKALQTSPVANQDQLVVSWSHPYDNHDYYEVTRGGEPIGMVPAGETLAFIDTTGIPGHYYKYQVTAIKLVNGQPVASTPVTSQARFPFVSQALNLMAHAGINHISLSWQHLSDRAEGYKVFRDDQNGDFEEIADISKTTQMTSYDFMDTTGVPGQHYEYSVATYAFKNGERYEARASYDTITYVSLATPDTFVAGDTGNGTVKLDWSYSAQYHDGFSIYRDDVLIATLGDPVLRTFTDTEGIPDSTYNYSIESFAFRKEQQYVSQKLESSISYPKVAAPTHVSASDGIYQNHVLVSWGYETLNNDAFVIQRDSVEIARIAGGKRQYMDVWNSDHNTSHTYAVQAVRTINGQDYLSDAVTDSGSTASAISGGSAALSSLTATDGDYPNYVKLTWAHPNTGTLKRFDIYRDSVLIDNVSAINTVYNDLDATPGKIHLYQVVALDNMDADSQPFADKGHRLANGSLRGSVITLQGGDGVPGVTINATAQIGGEWYQYQTTTDQEGVYNLADVYYGEEENLYRITASYPQHTFTQDTLEARLNAQENIAQYLNFFDETAFLIKGTIGYAQAACRLDSVKVTLTAQQADGNLLSSEEVYTNAEGDYSVVINPMDPNVASYTLHVDSARAYGEGTVADTSWHAFSPATVTIANQGLGLTTVQDFADTTAYPVTLLVQNTCGPIGTDQFDIRVTSETGCFDRTYRTADNGMVIVELPPLNYTMRVLGVASPSPETLPVVDYLRVRPARLDLFALHNTERRGNLENLSDTMVAFTYHQQPQIAVTGGFDSYLCNDPTQAAIVQQGELYTLSLEVKENHNGSLCSVNEGFLVIKNASADQPDTVLYYNDTINGFLDYTFTAGDPNTITPYTLGMVVEYHTKSAGFIGEYIQPIIVEGSKNLPGSDVIVNPGENGIVQLPLFVLRDPPGDGSYSYIEKGAMFEKSIEVGSLNGGFGGIKTENRFGINGGGFAFEIDASGGGSKGKGGNFHVSITTNERIATSASSETLTKDNVFVLGSMSDVIVGAGLVSSYGITDSVWIDGCEVKKTSNLGVGIGDIKTTWVYTVQQIRELIAEYDKNILDIGQGIFEIDGMSSIEAQSYLNILRNNWQQIIQYHEKTTLPHYNLCTTRLIEIENKINKTKDKGEKELLEALKSRINQFCSNVIKFEDEKKTLNREFEWHQDRIDEYNNIRRKSFELKNDMLDYDRTGHTVTDNALGQVDLSAAYDSLIRWEAKNITFGGTTEYSEEVSTSMMRSHSFTQNSYFDISTFLGIHYRSKTDVGVFVEQNAFAFEGTTGLQFGYNFEFEETAANTKDETTAVGYVLTDDDFGDQFSVTVVKGIDPSHTPYFQLLGGRSSCPYEEGTIARDIPQLDMEFPDGTLANAVQYNVDPDGVAIFPLKITNLNPFGESRWLQLYAVENGNTKNASLKINGNPFTTLDFFVPPQESIYVDLSIAKALGDVYDYEDIKIGFRAVCDQFQVADIKELAVHFRRPCSPISLVSDGNRTVNRGGTADGDRWVLNKAPQGEREQLFLKLVDYDPESEVLEEVSLEYRRVGTNHWTSIITLEKDSLKNYYEQLKLTYSNPTYPYVWDITDLDLADGEYEVRAMTACGTSGENFSNLLTGIIDRTSLQVFGNPEPSDGVLSPGEDILVTFNEAIDCDLFDPTSVTLANISNGGNVAVNASAACSGNQLALVVDHATLAALDGDTLQVTVASALDVYGNELENPVTWQFTVHYEPVYWLPNSLEVDVFKGESTTLTAQLFNSSGTHQEFLLSGYEGLSWLTVSETGGTVLPSGKPVDLGIDTKMLDVGSYTQTLTAAITGYQDEAFALTVNVLPERPNWEVDLGQYAANATVIANFNLDNTGLSADTLDLISVWMGNSLRGVSNITKVSEGSYVAYITVAGSPADAGEVLSFRVWDASTGTEYDAHPGQTYTYSKDVRHGTTVSPVILTVDSNHDVPRYIPLRVGWNWFSVNTSSTDMSVDNVFKSLSPMEGDQLKTLNSTSSYSDTLGWESLDGLDSISTNQGYLLYLAKADTLRLAGAEAVPQNISLLTGWNLIGYPLQEALAANTVLSINNPTNGDILKGDRSLAEYRSDLEEWTGMGQLQPYQSYMLHMGQFGLLSYQTPANPGTVINRDKDELGVNPGTAIGEVALSMVRSASDWSVDPTDYEYNMTFTGAITLEEGQEVHPGSKILAFVGEECRGIGELVYIGSLDRYEASLFVYANTEGEEVTFKIMDEEIAKVYGTVNKEVFVANTHYGSFTEPYLFQGGEVLSSSIVLMAHPNPFEEEVTVKFNTEGSGPHHWVLRDEVGALILSGEVEAVRGMNALILDLGRELPSGVYLLSLTGPTTHETIKLMKH